MYGEFYNGNTLETRTDGLVIEGSCIFLCPPCYVHWVLFFADPENNYYFLIPCLKFGDGKME